MPGELIIYDPDNTHASPRFKVGDGTTKVNDLPFVEANGGIVANFNEIIDANDFDKFVRITKEYMENGTNIICTLSVDGTNIAAPVSSINYISDNNIAWYLLIPEHVDMDNATLT